MSRFKCSENCINGCKKNLFEFSLSIQNIARNTVEWKDCQKLIEKAKLHNDACIADYISTNVYSVPAAPVKPFLHSVPAAPVKPFLHSAHGITHTASALYKNVIEAKDKLNYTVCVCKLRLYELLKTINIETLEGCCLNCVNGCKYSKDLDSIDFYWLTPSEYKDYKKIVNEINILYNAPAVLVKLPAALVKLPAALVKLPAALVKLPAALVKLPAALVKLPAALVKLPAAHVKLPAAPAVPVNPSDTNLSSTCLNAAAGSVCGAIQQKNYEICIRKKKLYDIKKHYFKYLNHYMQFVI